MAELNVLPLTLRFASLPANFQATPQEIADAIAEGMEIVSQQQFALFVKGAAEPFSDVGPWLDNSTTIGTWKVYDYITGRYEPMALDSESLRYILSADAPDESKYDLWVQLDGDGAGTGIKHFSGGSWKDIYAGALAAVDAAVASVNGALSAYSTTAQMNTAISTAIGGIPGPVDAGAGAAAFRAEGSNQLISGSSQAVVALGSEIFDPANAFSANTFTAPSAGYYQFNAYLHTEVNSGTPVSAGFVAYIRRNTGANTPGSEGDATVFGSNIIPISTLIKLDAGDTVDLFVFWNITGGATFKIGGMLSGYKAY